VLYRTALFPVTLGDPNYPNSATSRYGIKWLNRSSSVLAQGFPRLILHYTMLEGNSGIAKKYGYFPLKLSPKLWTLKISQLRVNHRRCCQLMWTVSVINWSSITSLSHTDHRHLCAAWTAWHSRGTASPVCPSITSQSTAKMAKHNYSRTPLVF